MMGLIDIQRPVANLVTSISDSGKEWTAFVKAWSVFHLLLGQGLLGQGLTPVACIYESKYLLQQLTVSDLQCLYKNPTRGRPILARRI